MTGNWRRRRPDALLHQSDQYSQYASERFQRVLAAHRIACSVSPASDARYISAMESFCSPLNIEGVSRRVYATRDEASVDAFDHVERIYGPRRRHSALGHLSPINFERSLRDQAAA